MITKQKGKPMIHWDDHDPDVVYEVYPTTGIPHIDMLNSCHVATVVDGRFVIRTMAYHDEGGISSNAPKYVSVFNGVSTVDDLRNWYANVECPIIDQVAPRHEHKNIVDDWMHSPYRRQVKSYSSAIYSDIAETNLTKSVKRIS